MENIAAHSQDGGTEKYLSTALNIGFDMAREAIWDKERCTWIGHGFRISEGKQESIIQSNGIDFYNGNTGIAFFLTQLFLKTKDPIIERTMYGCINQVISILNKSERLVYHGYYAGNIGVAYNLIRIGQYLKNKNIEDLGENLMKEICGQLSNNDDPDLLIGISGIIPCLINYSKISGASDYSEELNKLGKLLIDSAIKTNSYWSWKSKTDINSLTGYSHGAAAISLALLELFIHTGNRQFYDAAIMGFNFERSVFSPQVQNWPDLRQTGPNVQHATPVYGNSWCHGAPGIGISRVRAWELTGDQQFKGEAEIGLNTTYQSLYYALSNPNANLNYSLCHGYAGNAEILL